MLPCVYNTNFIEKKKKKKKKGHEDKGRVAKSFRRAAVLDQKMSWGVPQTVSRSAITKHPGGCTYHDCAGLLNDLINRTC